MAVLSLVVMAAGIGSRYRGAKQVEPVGPAGETLLDYGVFDALRSGLSRVVLVTRPELEPALRARAEPWRRHGAEVVFAFQQLHDLPPGLEVPANRARPWGTGHAVLAARDAVDGPFVVVNADDFYGRAIFEALASFLSALPAVSAVPARAGAPSTPGSWALAAFPLAATLSPQGPVARGICEERAGRLTQVEEVLGLVKEGDGAVSADGRRFAGDTPTSMNVWGFTPALFPPLAARFAAFLAAAGDDPRAEFLLPQAVSAIVDSGAAAVHVLRAEGTWFGLTHPGDREAVVARLAALHAVGDYPTPLFPA